MAASDVDGTDRKILQLLAADGRMSFTDLGKATGLSTSAVHQRVKRLEQRGLILGYGATVNHDEIGLPLDRKSTRLNSSHANISYAVFCLKKKKKNKNINPHQRKHT